MNHGKILQIGSPDAIYNNPTNLLVAKFVGSPTINILEAEITEDKYVIEESLLKYEPNIIQRKRLDKYKGKKVHFCIRSEDIEIKRDGTSNNSFRCEVYNIENMGMENIFSLRIGKTILKAITPSTFGTQIGDNVNATFNKDKIYFFDISNKKRIK